MKELVFIDLDGTLIDTSERHYRVFIEALACLGKKTAICKYDFWEQKRNGLSTLEIYSRIYGKEREKELLSIWLDNIEKEKYLEYDRIFDDALMALDFLHQRAKLVLITLRNNREGLDWELERMNLMQYFSECIVGNPTDKSGKIELLNDRISGTIDKERCLIIGDSEIDIKAGKQVGITTIAISRGIRSYSFLQRLGPERLLRNLRGVTNIWPKMFIR